jgi:hypothetical protein
LPHPLVLMAIGGLPLERWRSFRTSPRAQREKDQFPLAKCQI